MHYMRVFAIVLLTGLATAYRPAADGILQRPGRKFSGGYIHLFRDLCAIDLSGLFV